MGKNNMALYSTSLRSVSCILVICHWTMKTWEAMRSKFISEEAPRLPPLTPTYPNSVSFCPNGYKFTFTKKIPLTPQCSNESKCFFRKRSLASMIKAHSAQPLHPGDLGPPGPHFLQELGKIKINQDQNDVTIMQQPAFITNKNINTTKLKPSKLEPTKFTNQQIRLWSADSSRFTNPSPTGQPHVAVASLHPMGLACPADAAPSALKRQLESFRSEDCWHFHASIAHSRNLILMNASAQKDE